MYNYSLALGANLRPEGPDVYISIEPHNSEQHESVDRRQAIDAVHIEIPPAK